MSWLPADVINSALFTWLVVPLLIFIARVLDVSLSTMHMIHLIGGQLLTAPLLSLFEVLIWLIAIRQEMQTSTTL